MSPLPVTPEDKSEILPSALYVACSDRPSLPYHLSTARDILAARLTAALTIPVDSRSHLYSPTPTENAPVSYFGACHYNGSVFPNRDEPNYESERDKALQHPHSPLPYLPASYYPGNAYRHCQSNGFPNRDESSREPERGITLHLPPSSLPSPSTGTIKGTTVRQPPPLQKDLSQSSRGPRPIVSLNELYVSSAPHHLDVVDMFDIDRVPALLEQVLLQLDPTDKLYKSMRLSSKTKVKAFARGAVPLPGFVLDDAGRIWHHLTTSLFVIRHLPPHFAIVKPSEIESATDNRWAQLLTLILGSMLLTSAGVSFSSAEPSCDISVSSVIVLQTIREMLHWRHTMHALLARFPPDTSCTLANLGDFSIANACLCYSGSTTPDLRYLDPATWTNGTTLAQGLLAWTNVSVSTISDPLQLLKSVDVTKCNAADWARIALSFDAARNLDHSLAFVGLIRLLVVRHHAPASGDPTLLCANEFLDRAVAVPELEACLPEVLDVHKTYASGHDMDTGAMTAVELLERQTANASAQISTGGTSGISHTADRRLPTPKPMAGISLRGLPLAKDRRVVMSVWTSPITGSEWQVPLTVAASIDLRREGAKYQLCTSYGQVTYKKVGMRRQFRDQVSRVTQVQTPFISLQREPRRTSGAEESGSVAISNALARGYGDDACLHMLSWLHRGFVTLSTGCTAASFVPRSSHRSDIVVNQRLDYEIARRMVFARKGHELFWLPGEALPCFRVRNCSNGTYKVTEAKGLPIGAELCKAEIAKDFG